MPRQFTAASSEYITANPGTLGTPTAVSYAFLVNRTATGAAQQLFRVTTSGGTPVVSGALGVGNSPSLGNASASVAASASLTATSGSWCLITASKPAGTSVVSFGVYSYSTGSWTRDTPVTTLADPSGVPSTIALGRHQGSGSYFNGAIAVAAIWTRALSTAEFETLPHNLRAWIASRPAIGWLLDQASTSVPILDWTGGGANQSAITGTSVSTLSLPALTYGHPAAPVVTHSVSRNLFTTQTPAITNASDGTPGITTATTVRFSTAGTVTGARFYSTTTVSGVYTVALWSVDSSDPGTGTLLASKTMTSAPAAGTWNSVNFDAPVTVSTGVAYRVGLFSGDGRYVATTNFTEFIGGSGGLTNGDIFGPPNGDNPVGSIVVNQGAFEINASLTYPNDSGNASNYFVDVNFIADAGGGGPVVHDAATTLAATAALTATGTREHVAASALAGVGALTAAGIREHAATTSLAGTGALSSVGDVGGVHAATLAGVGALTAAAVREHAAAGDLAAVATLTAAGLREHAAASALAAAGALGAVPALTTAASASLAAVGALSAVATVSGVSGAAPPSGRVTSETRQRVITTESRSVRLST